MSPFGSFSAGWAAAGSRTCGVSGDCDRHCAILCRMMTVPHSTARMQEGHFRPWIRLRTKRRDDAPS